MPKAWSIPGVTRRSTLVEAAGRSVLMRVGALTEALDRARGRSDNDNLTEVRRSLRRLAAGVSAYARALPDEQVDWLRTQASDLLRPASELRDIDAQLERLRLLRETAPEQAWPGVDALITDLEGRETGVALTVQKAVDAFQSTNVLQQFAAVVESVTGIGLTTDDEPDEDPEDWSGDETDDADDPDYGDDPVDDVDGLVLEYALEDDAAELDFEYVDEDEPSEPETAAAPDDDALDEQGDPDDDASLTLSAQAGRARDFAAQLLAGRFQQLDRSLGSAVEAMRQPLTTDRLSAASREVLNQVRVGARRLGYATDIFTPVFGRPLERVSLELDELQSLLGGIHDADVIAGTVITALGDLPATDDRVAGYLFVLADARARRELMQSRLERDWRPDRIEGLQRRLAASASSTQT